MSDSEITPNTPEEKDNDITPVTKGKISSAENAEPSSPTAEAKDKAEPEPDPNTDIKSKLKGLEEKRNDFFDKVKRIATAEDKPGAIKDAFKSGKALNKEANEVKSEIKGKQKKGKSSGKGEKKDDEEEEIGSLYAALMAMINGIKSIRQDVRTMAEQNKVELPKPKMDKEDKQFMKEYPAQRQALMGQHDNTLKDMNKIDDKFTADKDSLNKDYDKKIDEARKNGTDANPLIDEKNNKNKELYDNYTKDRGVKEKESDDLKGKISGLDNKAENIQNKGSVQTKNADTKDTLNDRKDTLKEKVGKLGEKVDAIGKAEGISGKANAILGLAKEGISLMKEGRELSNDIDKSKGKAKSSGNGKKEDKDDEKEIGSLDAALQAILDGIGDLMKQVKGMADKAKVKLPQDDLKDANKAQSFTQVDPLSPKSEEKKDAALEQKPEQKPELKQPKPLPEIPKPEEQKDKQEKGLEGVGKTRGPVADPLEAKPELITKPLPEIPKSDSKKQESAEPKAEEKKDGMPEIPKGGMPELPKVPGPSEPSTPKKEGMGQTELMATVMEGIRNISKNIAGAAKEMSGPDANKGAGPKVAATVEQGTHNKGPSTIKQSDLMEKKTGLQQGTPQQPDVANKTAAKTGGGGGGKK